MEITYGGIKDFNGKTCEKVVVIVQVFDTHLTCETVCGEINKRKRKALEGTLQDPFPAFHDSSRWYSF